MDQYISWQHIQGHVKYMLKTKNQALVMLFSLVASNGLKMPMVFIDKGIKIDTNVYLEILEIHVNPWIEQPRGQCQPMP